MITKCQRCGSRDITWKREDYYRCNTCKIYAKVINQKLINRKIPTHCPICDSDNVVGTSDFNICKDCGSEVRFRKSTVKRRIFNNYDTWMYTVHNTKYGLLRYCGVQYDCDDELDRLHLMIRLVNNDVIELDESINNLHYRFKDSSVINSFRETFAYKDQDNANLNSKAVILNLKKVRIIS